MPGFCLSNHSIILHLRHHFLLDHVTFHGIHPSLPLKSMNTTLMTLLSESNRFSSYIVNDSNECQIKLFESLKIPKTLLYLQISKSSSQQVVLREATRALAGRFRCEVSADAPSFHTQVRSAYIHVVGKYVNSFS